MPKSKTPKAADRKKTSRTDLPLIFSPDAQEDYEDILLYTLQNWGERQMEAYDALLRQALRSIADDPASGRPCPELNEAWRSLRAGRHMIFYRQRPGAISVLRILHERMNPQLHL